VRGMPNVRKRKSKIERGCEYKLFPISDFEILFAAVPLTLTLSPRGGEGKSKVLTFLLPS
jgi:hypothetical protein